MSQKIRDILSRKKAFIPYITVGDPNLDITLSVLKSLSDNGADIIELGVPFTDPIADGPTIQKATERALQNPFNMEDIFELVSHFRSEGYETPILLMSYANPVFVMGYEVFAKKAVEAGVDAALLTDLPPEEADDHLKAASNHGLGTVFLCSPTTTLERLKMIDDASSAFVYYVARAGVTGVQSELPKDVEAKLRDLKSSFSNPLCVGFGISTPDQVKTLKDHADGIIVGSAIVKMFENHEGQDLLNAVGDFTKKMAGALS